MFWGGSSGTGYVKDLYGYSPSENKWAALASYKESAYGVSVCTQDDNVYAVAGITSARWYTELYTYSSNTWTQFASLKVIRRWNVSFRQVLFIKDSIILIGGESLGESNLAVRDTIYRYDMINQEWAGCGNFLVPIKAGVSITSGDSVFVGLGNKPEDGPDERGLWINTSGNWSNWTRLAETPPEMKNVCSGVLFKRLLILYRQWWCYLAF